MRTTTVRQCRVCGRTFSRKGKQTCSLACLFNKHVDRNGPVPARFPELGACHVWIGEKNENGYGRFKVELRKLGAHRVAFYLAHNRWPQECALHKCDNSSCVNPVHLFEGSHTDNMLDMISKGRDRKVTGERHWKAKLSDSDVRTIRAVAASGEPRASIRSRFGLSKTHVAYIVSNKSRKVAP